jgi:flagellar biosynthesis/type III secretory pathway M-ring protein FliF/YscJ
MEASAVQAYQWLVWVIGVLVFGGVIGLVITAIVRARRRPTALHSAAERLQREAPQAPEVDARLRALSLQKQQGQISEADYETRRTEILAGR